MIAHERRRQLELHGYTPGHDTDTGAGEVIEPWINEPWRQAKASKWRLG